jgi:hypothetical protein
MISSSEVLDWDKAKSRFDGVRQSYLDLDGVPGVNVAYALNLVIEPIARRYNAGERTEELYEEMMSLE